MAMLAFLPSPHWGQVFLNKKLVASASPSLG